MSEVRYGEACMRRGLHLARCAHAYLGCPPRETDVQQRASRRGRRSAAGTRACRAAAAHGGRSARSTGSASEQWRRAMRGYGVHVDLA